MDQAEIRRRYQEAKGQIEKAKLEYELAVGGPRGVVDALTRICTHPAEYQTSCMGDLGWACPDCGMSR